MAQKATCPKCGEQFTAGARRTKIDDDEVKRRRDSGQTVAEIVAALGVTQTTVNSAIRRIKETYPNWSPPDQRHRPRPQTDHEEMRRLRASGLTLRANADRLGTTQGTVCRVLRGYPGSQGADSHVQVHKALSGVRS